MRPPAPSSVEILETTSARISEGVRALASSTPGPSTHVVAPADQLTSMVRGLLSDGFLEVDAKWRRKLRRQVVAAALCGFVGAASASAWTWVQGKATGHLEGRVEGALEERAKHADAGPRP
jgi:hypothetical protein